MNPILQPNAPSSATAPGRRVQRACGGLASLWRRGWLERPRLSELIRNSAGDEHAFREVPPPPWHRALAQLVDSLEHEARLNEIGVTFAHVQLTGWLRQRARAQRLWRDQPASLRWPIERPVIVLGQMRSGTTMLQRLLGCDPRFQHTRFYEMMRPLPARPDLRVLTSWAELKLLRALQPDLAVIHPTSPRAVEEAFGLLSCSFYGAQIEAQWRVPGFARHWEGEDRAWVYREFKQLLQTIAWRRGDGSRPWVLKAPQFMEDLEPLLAVLPDARLVCLHRDPAQVVASSASLVRKQMELQSDDVDPNWIGAEWLKKTARRERTRASVLAARADVPRIDIAFEAMSRDWLSEMHRLYRFLELELTPEVERRMRRYLQRAERSGFRRHSYRLEDFGLDAEAVRSAINA